MRLLKRRINRWRTFKRKKKIKWLSKVNILSQKNPQKKHNNNLNTLKNKLKKFNLSRRMEQSSQSNQCSLGARRLVPIDPLKISKMRQNKLSIVFGWMTKRKT